MPRPSTTTRPLAPVPRWLGSLFAPLYAGVIARRNAAFDRGKGVVELDRPVISVGNLSVGGTGKSPMVKRLVALLYARGFTPAIAMRGYGAVHGASDEMLEYTLAFRDLPIVAQPNRTEGLLDLFAEERGAAVDCVLLDDGFQHRRIARQLDIVLIDLTQDPFNDRLLPAGWLREPVASLARAGVVVLTHAEAPGVDPERVRNAVRQVAPQALIATARHHWADLRVVGAGGDRTEPVEWLKSRRVLVACAVGNPAGVVEMARQASAGVVGEFIRPDHDPYMPSTVEALRREVQRTNPDAVVITGKDWVKLQMVPPAAWGCDLVVPRLEMALDDGGEALDARVIEVASSRPAAD